MLALEAALEAQAREAAEAAGAVDITAVVQRDVKTVQIDGRDVFLEAKLRAEISGRPRIAS